MKRTPQQTQFARQALQFFLKLYEGKPLPEGAQLLSVLQRVFFPGKRKLSAEEARWVAQQLIESRRPSLAGTLWRIITRPEDARPEADITRPAREVSAIEAMANLLRTPQRALTASAVPSGKQYGKEAGQPTTARSWAEAYASDPTWGSVLEALFPSLPRPLRQALGIAGDVVIDPLNLLGALGIIGKGAETFTATRKAAQAARSLSESSVPILRQAGQTLSRELPALSFMDRAASENLAKWLGINPATAAQSKSPLRPLGLILNWLLDPSVTGAAIREGKQAEAGQKLSKTFASLAQARELRKRVAESGPVVSREAVALKHRYRGLPEEALQYARRAVESLDESHPDVQALKRVEEHISQGISYAPGEDVERVYRLAVQGGWQPPEQVPPSIRQIASGLERETGGWSEAARTEQERLQRMARETSDVLDRALSLWKSTKTVANPPSFVRNFFQNFILRYMEGEQIDPVRIGEAVARLAKNPERFKQLWQATETRAGSIQDTGRGLSRVLDRLGQWYEGADRLASVIMAEATGKPPTAFLMNYGEVPQVLEFMRRRGIAPFIAWQYFAVPAIVRGMVNAPVRTKQVLHAVTALQPTEDKRGESIQVGNREMRIGNILPINPADYGAEMEILDPRNSPYYSAGRAVEQLFFAQGRESGYRPMGSRERLHGWEGLAAFLKDFWLPPALGYYLPGLISPSQAKPGERKPRQRLDYILGLAGFPTRPVDASADLRSEAWKRIVENRQQAQQMMRMIQDGMGAGH
ncbi:MAG: hypothetical protein KatS3mg023_0602 [Armatimonadota bacterium]|nr:MAG: hypothetical protein KatS3mg023_0602 [Armatimonadota bacterium]